MECTGHPPRQAARDLNASACRLADDARHPEDRPRLHLHSMRSDTLDDPVYLPFQLDLDRQRLLLVRLDAQQRADASFLDQRALPAQPQGVWVPLSMLPTANASAHAADYLFHIGHCGSTLLSQLLQSWSALQVLREPLPLRSLAAMPAPDSALLRKLCTLWARPLAPASRTLIKATSSCNALIEPLLGVDPRSRALLLDMPLTAYLATILKSESSLADVRAAASGRAAVLATTTGQMLVVETLTAPQLCASGWLGERVRFAALSAGTMGGRVLRIDFEALLAEPQATLSAIAAHLHLDADGVELATSARAWQRYSKAAAHHYDRQDRQHDLALARRRFAAQIEEGMRWAREFVARHPQLTDAVSPLP